MFTPQDIAYGRWQQVHLIRSVSKKSRHAPLSLTLAVQHKYLL